MSPYLHKSPLEGWGIIVGGGDYYAMVNTGGLCSPWETLSNGHIYPKNKLLHA